MWIFQNNQVKLLFLIETDLVCPSPSSFSDMQIPLPQIITTYCSFCIYSDLEWLIYSDIDGAGCLLMTWGYILFGWFQEATQIE